MLGNIRRLLHKRRYERMFPNALIEMGASAASDCKLGDHVRVCYGTKLLNAQIGSFSYIASDSLLADISIGKFCSIGPCCLAGTGEHPTNWVSTSPVFFSAKEQCGISFAKNDHFDERKPISIENDVWIGAKVFIRDGVSIGNGAIVAAGAVVVKDVAPYAIVGGVPSKIIKYRFSDKQIAELLRIQWWDWNVNQLAKAQPLFASTDIDAFIEWANMTAHDNNE